MVENLKKWVNLTDIIVQRRLFNPNYRSLPKVSISEDNQKCRLQGCWSLSSSKLLLFWNAAMVLGAKKSEKSPSGKANNSQYAYQVCRHSSFLHFSLYYCGSCHVELLSNNYADKDLIMDLISRTWALVKNVQGFNRISYFIVRMQTTMIARLWMTAK